MSYAEDLCSQSLEFVLQPDVHVIRNYRPNFLKNPATGKNLEIDFYLVGQCVGIEVQGPHHYDSEKQRQRDDIKRGLLQSLNVDLIELSITEASPTSLAKKLKRYGVPVRPFQEYQASSRDLRKRISAYRRTMRLTYPDSPALLSPDQVKTRHMKQEARESLKEGKKGLIIGDMVEWGTFRGILFDLGAKRPAFAYRGHSSCGM